MNGMPTLTARANGEYAARPGDTIYLTPEETHIHRFDASRKAIVS
jgi:multiple sugar transport system ATP-binding protein